MDSGFAIWRIPASDGDAAVVEAIVLTLAKSRSRVAMRHQIRRLRGCL
jgi:hypothetical protein